MKFMKHLALITVVLSAVPLVALAQAGGSITGTVTDPNGAVIAGASITATQTATGNVFNAATSAAGLYAFPLLPTGPYSIKVSQTGFKTLVREGIEVRVGLTEVIDLRLELGT